MNAKERKNLSRLSDKTFVLYWERFPLSYFWDEKNKRWTNYKHKASLHTKEEAERLLHYYLFVQTVVIDIKYIN